MGTTKNLTDMQLALMKNSFAPKKFEIILASLLYIPAWDSRPSAYQGIIKNWLKLQQSSIIEQYWAN